MALSEWLARLALTAHGSGSSRVFVTCETGTSKVAGYYALAAGQVAQENASERLKQGMGRYPVPVVVLTRLGVDLGHQRKGLGVALVTDALRRVEQAADQIGIRGLLIHAESPSAKAFYLHYARFEESPTAPLHLMILMKDLRKAIADAVEGPIDSEPGFDASA